jgi:preprotein translocase subunit SecA
MGEIYRFKNLTVGLIQEQMTEKEKQINYNTDITYLTNTELAFVVIYLCRHSKLCNGRLIIG